MKVVLILLITLAVVYGESCDGVDTTKCQHEICITPNEVPTCITNICTCAPKPAADACTILSDCNMYWSGHHCGHHNRQCLNGHCTCKHGNHG